MVKISCFLFGIVALGFISTANASISVNVDRSTISQDESFYLEFSSDSDVDDDPDFGPLNKDFRVISRSNSSSMKIINGRVSRSNTWTLMVIAKKAGTLIIPSVRFGRDRSPETTIEIRKAGKSSGIKGTSALFIEADTDRKSLYVQAQLLYTIRVYTSINLLNASLPEPRISDGDAIVEKFDNEASYEKNINGKRYKVFEKRYAIFPQKSGPLTIESTQFNGQYVDSRRALRTKVLRTKPINISVKAKPAVQTVQTNVWLPADKIQIKEEWPEDPPEFVVGVPVTRTLTMVASGLTSTQLPELHAANLADMKVYPDKPVLNDNKSTNGIIGIRQEKTAVIPTRAGEYNIPAIEIPWWNTRADRLEYASIPARKIQVAPAAAVATKSTGPAPAVNQSAAGVAGNVVATPLMNPAPMVDQKTSDFWMWFAFVASGGWVITLIAWMRKKPDAYNTPRETAVLDKTRNCGTLLKALKQSCRSHNAEAAKESLLAWGKCVFRSEPNSLGELARICGGPLASEIQLLGKTLYSQYSQQTPMWNGDGLLKALEEFSVPDQYAGLENKNDVILPLHWSAIKQ